MFLYIQIVWSKFGYTDDLNSAQNHRNTRRLELRTNQKTSFFRFWDHIAVRFTWWLSQAVRINKPLLLAIKNYPTHNL
jgi:hypothetical protein